MDVLPQNWAWKPRLTKAAAGFDTISHNLPDEGADLRLRVAQSPATLREQIEREPPWRLPEG